MRELDSCARCKAGQQLHSKSTRRGGGGSAERGQTCCKVRLRVLRVRSSRFPHSRAIVCANVSRLCAMLPQRRLQSQPQVGYLSLALTLSLIGTLFGDADWMPPSPPCCATLSCVCVCVMQREHAPLEPHATHLRARAATTQTRVCLSFDCVAQLQTCSRQQHTWQTRASKRSLKILTPQVSFHSRAIINRSID